MSEPAPAAASPGAAPLPLPPGARAQAAARSLPWAVLPLPLGGAAAWALDRAGQPAAGLGLLLGAGVGALLGLSWLAGTLLCWQRSLTALQATTLALWPLRVGGVIGALVWARSRELEPGAVLLGLLAAHVLGLVANARATGFLADAGRAVRVPGTPDGRSCNPPGGD